MRHSGTGTAPKLNFEFLCDRITSKVAHPKMGKEEREESGGIFKASNGNKLTRVHYNCTSTLWYDKKHNGHGISECCYFPDRCAVIANS